MLPSLRRAAIRAFRPHREQFPLMTRAAHAWETRPRAAITGQFDVASPTLRAPGQYDARVASGP